MKEEQLSKERVKELLEAEAKLERHKATMKKSHLKRNARIAIILRKAEEAGIVATEAEIDQYLAEKK